MSAKERQFQIVSGMIERSHLGMTIDAINQLGDESPDTHRFTLGCGCGDTVHITLPQGEDGRWVVDTLNIIRNHSNARHGTEYVTR